MKQFKLIRYDLKNGILCKWHSYMVPFLLALAFFADYSIRVWNRYGNEALFGGRVTLGDYLLYCFSGKRPYNPAEQVFLVPIAWLMIFVCSMLVTLNYSLQNLTGHGVQVMIRTQKRYRWWLAKCVYILGVHAATLAYSM